MLSRGESAFRRHYLMGSLPVSLRRLRGHLQLGTVQSDDQRLLKLEQLDISHLGWYGREAQECLAELLENSSPIGSSRASVVSEIGLDLMNMGTFLHVIACRCPALQVLRLHFRRPKTDVVDGPIDLPDITAYRDDIESLIDRCSALRRIELPVGGKAAWYQVILAAPWMRNCQAQDIEVWCCSDPSISSDYRLC